MFDKCIVLSDVMSLLPKCTSVCLSIYICLRVCVYVCVCVWSHSYMYIDVCVFFHEDHSHTS